jgi:hypothetical protein
MFFASSKHYHCNFDFKSIMELESLAWLLLCQATKEEKWVLGDVSILKDVWLKMFHVALHM